MTVVGALVASPTLLSLYPNLVGLFSRWDATRADEAG
jgi:hypothetical protein